MEVAKDSGGKCGCGLTDAIFAGMNASIGGQDSCGGRVLKPRCCVAESGQYLRARDGAQKRLTVRFWRGTWWGSSAALELVGWHAFYNSGWPQPNWVRSFTVSRNTTSKITLALFVFGIAFLDRDYSPFESALSLISAALILTLIFFGDIIVRWINRK